MACMRVSLLFLSLETHVHTDITNRSEILFKSIEEAFARMIHVEPPRMSEAYYVFDPSIDTY